MKLKKILAGTAAMAIAATTMAVSASAATAGPNGDNGYTVFGLYIGMTKDEGIANGILKDDGNALDEGEALPVTIKIDSIKFDGEEVTYTNDSPSIYWQGDEFKYELINIYNDKANGGKDGCDKVFTTMPSEKIEVTFTISGLKSGLAGSAYVGGGFATDGADWSSTFFGTKADEANPAGTTFDMPAITDNGTYTAVVNFPSAGGDDTSTPETSTPDTSKADTSTADKDTSTDTNSTAAATSTTDGGNAGASTDNSTTGATAGLALAGIAVAGAAIVVAKKRK